MKIPKKISPDRITDAIIELRYTTNLMFEVVPGMFYRGLDDTYFYTNRPLSKVQQSHKIDQKHPGQFTLTFGGTSIFYNDKIKIQLLPNSILFNIINEYISWDSYRPEIEKTLSQLQQSGVIEKFTRIGMRYISEYPDQDLHSCVKFSFTFGAPHIKSEKYSFQTEFIENNYKVILRLKHKQPTNTNTRDKAQANIVSSTIDIDTILDDIEIADVKSVMEKIDNVHTKEKEVFFNLLKEDFLETLNPEY